MTLFHEQARAKINLTLKILGKRPDGFHELESLVVFADAGDRLILDTSRPACLSVDGPFAAALKGPNVLEVILATLATRYPGIVLGAVQLTKNLPVAAGIGGGSSDAGALLRAIRWANPALNDSVNWMRLASEFGADVPVCFADMPAWMFGKGDRLVPLAAPLPPLAAVIANPLAPVPADKTARVFRQLNALPVSASGAENPCQPALATTADIAALIDRAGNELAGPASYVVPAARDTLDAVRALKGSCAHGLSGAGPTAFALFDTLELAERAARELNSAHPRWWVTAARIA